MAAFLTKIGFPQYATPDWIKKFDEEIACDSIEDLTFLESDDDYLTLGMPEDHAETIEEEAHIELLRRFLAAIGMESALEGLLQEGYQEIEELMDLEEDEAEDVHLAPEQIRTRVGAAELHVPARR